MSGDHTVTMKLTKRAVDALGAGPERYLAWDIELKGFGVRVSRKVEKPTSCDTGRSVAHGGC
jgi:hypothetical protein